MSYNILNFKIKKIENLVIPMSAFKVAKDGRKNYLPRIEVIDNDTMEVELECGCEQLIKGIIKDDNLYVSDIEMYGEGSGNFMYYIFENALKQSQGYLHAVLIWEDGDTIERIIVNDGKYKLEKIDL